MIGKRPEEGIGKGFRGVVTYLLQGARQEKDPHRVTFTVFRNLAFEKNELVARQMRLVASQSKRVKNPVYHFVIAWRPEEAPSNEVMIQVADRTCRELGLAEHQAYYVGHDDTDHRHLHLVVNRVHPVSFRAWSPHNDFARIEVSLDRQSEELGYERVPGRHSNRARAQARQQELATSLGTDPGGNRFEEPDQPSIDHRRPKDSDYRKAYREQKPLPRSLLTDEQAQDIAARVATRFAEAGSWDELAKALAGEGVTLERKGQGLLLIHDNKTMKLSQLGKQVRYAELNTRFNETYDRYLERTSAGTAATAEPRHPWQRPQELEPEKRPAPVNQPTDDDAQGERGPGTARPPERTGIRDETSRPAPKQRGVARRRRLSRRRGSSAAEAQDAMPTRPMGSESRRLRPRRRSPVRETGEHPWREGGWSLKRASRRSRVATLHGKAAGASVDTKDPQHHKEHETEHRREKHVQEPPRKRVPVRSRAIEAPTRAPEDINRLLEQADAEVRQERGLLDGMAFDLGDLFRHVSQSQSVFTVTKIDILRFLDSLGLVPESQLEQAFENLEAEKQDPLLPSLMPEEPDREDDREM